MVSGDVPTVMHAAVGVVSDNEVHASFCNEHSRNNANYFVFMSLVKNVSRLISGSVLITVVVAKFTRSEPIQSQNIAQCKC